jgi:hypothetical protein
MGVISAPPQFPWPNPWTGTRLLVGAVSFEGFKLAPDTSWPEGFRPPAISVVLQVDQESVVSFYVKGSSGFGNLIGYVEDIVYDIGTHVIELDLDFTENNDIFEGQITLGHSSYTGTITSITFAGAEAPPFWTNKTLCVEI